MVPFELSRIFSKQEASRFKSRDHKPTQNSNNSIIMFCKRRLLFVFKLMDLFGFRCHWYKKKVAGQWVGENISRKLPYTKIRDGKASPKPGWIENSEENSLKFDIFIKFYVLLHYFFSNFHPFHFFIKPMKLDFKSRI